MKYADTGMKELAKGVGVGGENFFQELFPGLAEEIPQVKKQSPHCSKRAYFHQEILEQEGLYGNVADVFGNRKDSIFDC